MNELEALRRLLAIAQRLRGISEQEAASVLVNGLAAAGIFEGERDRLIAETESILDNLNA